MRKDLRAGFKCSAEEQNQDRENKPVTITESLCQNWIVQKQTREEIKNEEAGLLFIAQD